jgi:hypothetical protein
MRSLCRCLFLYCCKTPDGEVDDSDDEYNNNTRRGGQQQSYSSVSEYIHPITEGQGLISSRGIDELQSLSRINNVGGLPTATVNSTSQTTMISVNDSEYDDDNDNDDRGSNNNSTDNNNDNCCRPSSNNTESSLYDRIRRHLNLFHNGSNDAYNVVTGRDDEILHQYYTNSTGNNKKSLPPQYPSPLRQAISFNTTINSDNVPSCTINNDEIVLPGSLLQQQMAEEMMRKLSTSNSNSNDNNKILYNRSGSSIEECVICMEPFDNSNPRMPTLCNCGVNKTYFHLPCLYQWTEQCSDCPSCRTKLTWEEF